MKLRENIASSPAPGWRSQGTSIGTNAVIKPDPVTTAKDWVRNLGRNPSRRERDAWDIHAERSGLDPEAAEQGWNIAIAGTKSEEERAFQTLKTIFSETTSWVGMGVPPDAAAQTQAVPSYSIPKDPVAKLRKKSKPVTENQGKFGGVPRSPTQAVQATAQMRNTGLPQGPAPGFPFRTKAAERVWTFAQFLIPTHPEAGPPEIIRLAIQQSRMSDLDLTPEDILMLELAIDWAQNGPMKANVRGASGPPGAPGQNGPAI